MKRTLIVGGSASVIVVLVFTLLHNVIGTDFVSTTNIQNYFYSL